MQNHPSAKSQNQHDRRNRNRFHALRKSHFFAAHQNAGFLNLANFLGKRSSYFLAVFRRTPAPKQNFGIFHIQAESSAFRHFLFHGRRHGMQFFLNKGYDRQNHQQNKKSQPRRNHKKHRQKNDQLQHGLDSLHQHFHAGPDNSDGIVSDHQIFIRIPAMKKTGRKRSEAPSKPNRKHCFHIATRLFHRNSPPIRKQPAQNSKRQGGKKPFPHWYIHFSTDNPHKKPNDKQKGGIRQAGEQNKGKKPKKNLLGRLFEPMGKNHAGNLEFLHFTP